MSRRIDPNRMTVDNGEGIVVFLIGLRINKWWRIDKWLPVALAMPRMLRELEADPESGFLAVQARGPGVMVQYWRSTADLMRYARSKDGEHFPAWADFKRKVADTGVVGIWHETYDVPAGAYECIYHHMPEHGLGRVRPRITATGAHATAKRRLGQGEERSVQHLAS